MNYQAEKDKFNTSFQDAIASKEAEIKNHNRKVDELNNQILE